MRKKSEIVCEWWRTEIIIHSLIVKRELRLIEECTYEVVSNYYNGRIVGLEYALGLKTSFILGIQFEEKFDIPYMWDGIEEKDETFLQNMLIWFEKELALLDNANITPSC